jgi:TolB protein
MEMLEKEEMVVEAISKVLAHKCEDANNDIHVKSHGSFSAWCDSSLPFLNWVVIILVSNLSVTVFSQPKYAQNQNLLTPWTAGLNEIAYCYQSTSITMIYSINEDGTGNRRIVNVNYGLNHPDWSPDGTKIAVASQINQSTYSIRIMNADGSNIVRLTNTAGVIDVEPNWSPDGGKIAFGRMYPSQNGRRELWMMNSDGSNQHSLGILMEDAAEWSPDGKKLVYAVSSSQTQDLYTCNVDGSNVRQVTNLKQESLQGCWMPDGQSIVFNSTKGIFMMNNDGTEIRQLMNTIEGVWKAMPSPDGSKIAFCSCPPGLVDHWEIYVMNVDGTSISRLTYTSGTDTSVDPDWRPLKSTTEIQDKGVSLPVDMTLYQNYPNPFNPSTTIRYELQRGSAVKLEVYNVLGNKVKVLVNEMQLSGIHSVVWDGSDHSGQKVASGIYFIRLSQEGKYQMKKALFLK